MVNPQVRLSRSRCRRQVVEVVAAAVEAVAALPYLREAHLLPVRGEHVEARFRLLNNRNQRICHQSLIHCHLSSVEGDFFSLPQMRNDN